MLASLQHFEHFDWDLFVANDQFVRVDLSAQNLELVGRENLIGRFVVTAQLLLKGRLVLLLLLYLLLLLLNLLLLHLLRLLLLLHRVDGHVGRDCCNNLFFVIDNYILLFFNNLLVMFESSNTGVCSFLCISFD